MRISRVKNFLYAIFWSFSQLPSKLRVRKKSFRSGISYRGRIFVLPQTVRRVLHHPVAPAQIVTQWMPEVIVDANLLQQCLKRWKGEEKKKTKATNLQRLVRGSRKKRSKKRDTTYIVVRSRPAPGCSQCRKPRLQCRRLLPQSRCGKGCGWNRRWSGVCSSPRCVTKRRRSAGRPWSCPAPSPDGVQSTSCHANQKYYV